MFPAGVPSRLDVHIKHKSYCAASGGRQHVLGEFSIALANGEGRCLRWSLGCGTTTLLRIIVGLDHYFEGTVQLPAHGRLGVVFQEPRLLRWRTVEETRGCRAAGERHCTERAVERSPCRYRCHYPGELSLGLARRVALARAFAVEPESLVLDEPFVSLDAALATRLRFELVELVSRRPVTSFLSPTVLRKRSGSPIGSSCSRRRPRACSPTYRSTARASPGRRTKSLPSAP